LNETNS